MRVEPLLFVVAMLAVMAIGSVVRANDETNVRKELEARYASLTAAFKLGDMRAFMESLAPDFSFAPKNLPNLSRQQFEQRVKQLMVEPGSEWSVKIEKITVAKDQTVAITNNRFSHAFTDQQGRTHIYANTVKRRETWVKGDRGWVLKRIEDVKYGEFTIDGRPVRMDNFGLRDLLP